MTSKQRLAAIAIGQQPDKIPFLPTIIEHAAYLIGQTPSTVAQDASLMAEAHIKAYSRYCPDAVTIGVDIYNIEAEALGCMVRFYNDASIPGIISRPSGIDHLANNIVFTKNLGRIQLLLDAAARVNDEVGDAVSVSIGICGPFSVLIEILGYDTAMEALLDGDNRIYLLLDALQEFQKEYSSQIAALGLGVTVFESWASPPLISPEIYRQYALPYEQALFAHMKQLGLPARPLIIGGDTRHIVDDILTTGTTLLVSDYNAPLPLYVEKAREKGVTVRANIDPKLVQSGAWCKIAERIREIHAQAEIYPRLIAGTGVIPYDTPPEHLQHVKEMLYANI